MRVILDLTGFVEISCTCDSNGEIVIIRPDSHDLRGASLELHFGPSTSRRQDFINAFQSALKEDYAIMHHMH